MCMFFVLFFFNSKPGHILKQMSAMFFQNPINTFILSDCFLIIRLCFCQRLCCGAGGEPHHQLPSVSGTACRGREAGGPLRGNLRQGVPLGQRRRRAAETGRGGSWHGEPGPQRPAAACPTLRQLRRADRALRPGNGHDHERDGKHRHVHGRCR